MRAKSFLLAMMAGFFLAIPGCLRAASGAVVYFSTVAHGGCGPPLLLTSVPAGGSHLRAGTTIITTSASDACGDSTFCAPTVTVKRETGLEMVMGGLADMMLTGISFNMVPVLFTISLEGGWDSPLSLASYHLVGSPYPVGYTIGTPDTTNPSGENTNAVFSVTGDPGVFPDYVLNGSVNFTVDATSSEGTVVFFNVSADNGCGLPFSLVSTPSSGSFFPIGTTIVTTSACDPCGDIANATFSVTVNPPVAQKDPTNANAKVGGRGGSRFPLVSASPGGSFFPSGTAIVSVSASDPGGFESKATLSVPFNSSDSPGVGPENSTTKTRLTSRPDVATSPDSPGGAKNPLPVPDSKGSVIVLTCSSNLTVTASTPNGTNVYFTTSAFGGCISPLNISSSPSSGSTFPIGETAVTTTASDSCGDTANCSFTVTVNAKAEPPIVLTCSSNLTITASTPNGTNVYFTTSASGGCSSPLNLSSSPPSGSTFPIGQTTVTTTASDACGDVTNCSFTVTVNAKAEPPIVLTCSSNLTITASTPNGTNVYFTTSASGGCSSPLNLSSSPPSGSTFPIGQTTVTTTASDACGDVTNCSFTVTVNAKAEPPIVLTCSSNLTITASTPNGTNVYFTTSASGGCSSPLNLSSSPPSGSTFPIGQTTVTTTASDACGDVTNCSFTVTVNAKAEPPIVLTCSSNLTITASTPNGTNVYFTTSASGGCSSPLNLSSSPPSGSTFPIGQTTVTTTASDACGDVTNCSFTVTVNPIQPVLGLATVKYPFFELSWTEDSFGVGSPTNPPMFGLEVITGGNLLGSGSWTTFTHGFVRRINNEFLAQDQLNNGAFYRLNSTVTNSFIPSAITLAATSITANGAYLNGTATPVGNNTMYWFGYGTDNSYGLNTMTNTLATSTNPAALTYAVTGLATATSYHFQLVVNDDAGTQYGGDQSFVTTASQPPPTMVTLAASSITATSAVLNGSINGYGLADAAYFQYGVDTTYGKPNETNQFFGDGYSQAFDTTISGLAPLTTYHYRAVGYTLSGEAFGADASFTTPGLPPEVVTQGASSVTSDSAVLNGTINGEGTATAGYFVYWYYITVEGGGEWITNQTAQFYGPANYNGQSFSTTISNLDAITYYYQIVGFNADSGAFGAVTNFTRDY